MLISYTDSQMSIVTNSVIIRLVYNINTIKVDDNNNIQSSI